MRRLPLLLLVVLLLPSAALADVAASSDGSLVLAGASVRIISLQGNGLVFGHITQGTLTVLDYRPADTTGSVQVSGAMLKLPVGTSTQYSGSDVRFLFPNGRYVLRLDGVGIDISAVGRGAVSAIGIGSDNDGSLSTNGGKPLPIGVAPTTLVFGFNKPPNSPPTNIAKFAAH